MFLSPHEDRATSSGALGAKRFVSSPPFVRFLAASRRFTTESGRRWTGISMPQVPQQQLVRCFPPSLIVQHPLKCPSLWGRGNAKAVSNRDNADSRSLRRDIGTHGRATNLFERGFGAVP
jgi:hypothetical protein